MCTRVRISYTSIAQKAQSAKIETVNRTSDLFYINVFLFVASHQSKKYQEERLCTPVLLNVSYDKISGANTFLDISNGSIITSS
jgi:hypothetical protein